MQTLFEIIFLFTLLFTGGSDLVDSPNANNSRGSIATHDSLILVSTIRGTLIALDKYSGSIRWLLNEEPVLRVTRNEASTNLESRIYVPDPTDGSLYLLSYSDKERVSKLGMGIAELVAMSPFRAQEAPSPATLFETQQSDSQNDPEDSDSDEMADSQNFEDSQSTADIDALSLTTHSNNGFSSSPIGAQSSPKNSASKSYSFETLYTGEKRDSWLLVNALTGEIEKTLDSSLSSFSRTACPGPVPASSQPKTDQMDEQEKQANPFRSLIYIGRSEYSLNVFDAQTGTPLRHTRYHDYAAHAITEDLLGHYDLVHATSSSTGHLFTFDKNGRVLWSRDMGSLIVGIYQVWFRTRASDKQSDEDYAEQVRESLREKFKQSYLDQMANHLIKVPFTPLAPESLKRIAYNQALSRNFVALVRASYGKEPDADSDQKSENDENGAPRIKQSDDKENETSELEIEPSLYLGRFNGSIYALPSLIERDLFRILGSRLVMQLPSRAVPDNSLYIFPPLPPLLTDGSSSSLISPHESSNTPSTTESESSSLSSDDSNLLGYYDGNQVTAVNQVRIDYCPFSLSSPCPTPNSRLPRQTKLLSWTPKNNPPPNEVDNYRRKPIQRSEANIESASKIAPDSDACFEPNASNARDTKDPKRRKQTQCPNFGTIQVSDYTNSATSAASPSQPEQRKSPSKPSPANGHNTDTIKDLQTRWWETMDSVSPTSSPPANWGRRAREQDRNGASGEMDLSSDSSSESTGLGIPDSTLLAQEMVSSAVHYLDVKMTLSLLFVVLSIAGLFWFFSKRTEANVRAILEEMSRQQHLPSQAQTQSQETEQVLFSGGLRTMVGPRTSHSDSNPNVTGSRPHSRQATPDVSGSKQLMQQMPLGSERKRNDESNSSGHKYNSSANLTSSPANGQTQTNGLGNLQQPTVSPMHDESPLKPHQSILRNTIEAPADWSRIGKLAYDESDQGVLGRGFEGTVVFRALFDGRPAAVKRIPNASASQGTDGLGDLARVTRRELQLLREMNVQHAHLLRYLCMEEDEYFTYLGLELCLCTIQQLVERKATFSGLRGAPGGRQGLGTPEAKAQSELSALPSALRISPRGIGSSNTNAALCSFAQLDELIDQAASSLSESSILEQLLSGLVYLHSLSIAHRDLKPQNVMVTPPDARGSHRIVLGDFGFAKRFRTQSIPSNLQAQAELEVSASVTGALCGTEGWIAPEVIQQECALTQATDVFAAGCLFYYTFTGGLHPFDSPPTQTAYLDYLEALRSRRPPYPPRPTPASSDRQRNIQAGTPFLENMYRECHQNHLCLDAIKRALQPRADLRPTASQLMHHIMFWSKQQQLQFMQDVSDRIEKLGAPGQQGNAPGATQTQNGTSARDGSPAMPRRDSSSSLLNRIGERPDDPIDATDTALLQALEFEGHSLLKGDWRKHISPQLQADLRKFRNYRGDLVRDLVRAIRNKKHHYRELPVELQRSLGSLPDEFLDYFTSRFPRLLLHLYLAIEQHCRREPLFAHYFAV